MAITAITGMPGSGKSAAMMKLVDEAVTAGRPVYVNGVPDLKLAHVALSDDDVRNWPANVEDGGLVVIDEVQRIWRPRGATSKVPDEVQALETHRHRGLDFVIVTQHPKLIDSNVRALVGRHIHLRDNGVLGRWWYEWPEIGEPANYKTAPIQDKYTLPKAVFAKYKSASLHVKRDYKVPPLLVGFALCLVLLIAGGWYAYRSISGKLKPPEIVQPGQSGAPGAAARPGPVGQPEAPFVDQTPPASPPPKSWPVLAVSEPVVRREPFAGRGLHLVGSWGRGSALVLMFAVSVDGRTVHYLRGDALASAGYVVEHLAPCSGVLRWGRAERAYTCDAPALAPAAAPAPPSHAASGVVASSL